MDSMTIRQNYDDKCNPNIQATHGDWTVKYEDLMGYHRDTW